MRRVFTLYLFKRKKPRQLTELIAVLADGSVLRMPQGPVATVTADPKVLHSFEVTYSEYAKTHVIRTASVDAEIMALIRIDCFEDRCDYPALLAGDGYVEIRDKWLVYVDTVLDKQIRVAKWPPI